MPVVPTNPIIISLHVGSFTQLKVQLHEIYNDIPVSMADDTVTAFALLDFSTAFITIGHTILLGRLYDLFVDTGKALAWFKLYLTRKCHGIKLGDGLFSKADLPFGVPQGSVLGSLLFAIHTTPL